MPYLQKVFPNTYRDSVALMQISASLGEMAGIAQASLIMATDANIELLKDAGLLEAAPKAGPNDLLFAAEGNSDDALQAAANEAEAKLSEIRSAGTGDGPAKEPARSVQMALDEAPSANLALISVPGEYAAAEAEKSLNLGLDVMLFSDNVSVEDEIALKALAQEKNLLVMGPDCGTAIINGLPLAFANVVARGDIGIVAASGTGLQQVSCLVDNWGGGISQAIGTGGRDLSPQVGGATMLAALDALAADEATKVIVLISKPPAPDVAAKVLEKAAQAGKPVVVNFLGYSGEMTSDALTSANDLETAAVSAMQLAGLAQEQPARHLLNPSELTDLANSLDAEQKYVRGLYSGGTFSYEAMLILGDLLGPIHSSTPLSPEHKLNDPWTSSAHTVVDLGDDTFTRGRPHPMIDHRIRNERMLQEAKDPETAVILLDVVLGHGSHRNPAEEMIPAIAAARDAAPGAPPVFVGFVCGTSGDPQNLEKQETLLGEAGVLLMESNAQSARLAGDLVLAGGK